MLNVDAFPSNYWQYIDMLILGPAPATVENIDHSGQNFRSRSLGASKSERQTREYAGKMFQKRCTCFFDNIWAISAKFWTFRSILDFRAVINSQYIVNILLSPALRSSAGCSNPCKYWQYIDYWWPFQLLQQSIQLFCRALHKKVPSSVEWSVCCLQGKWL